MGEITYDPPKQMGMNAELAATDWANSDELSRLARAGR